MLSKLALQFQHYHDIILVVAIVRVIGKVNDEKQKVMVGTTKNRRNLKAIPTLPG